MKRWGLLTAGIVLAVALALLLGLWPSAKPPELTVEQIESLMLYDPERAIEGEERKQVVDWYRSATEVKQLQEPLDWKPVLLKAVLKNGDVLLIQVNEQVPEVGQLFITHQQPDSDARTFYSCYSKPLSEYIFRLHTEKT